MGLGKLGLCLAAVLADTGYQVLGIELDEAKVDAVNRGRSPIYEPGLDELIQENSKRLSASASFEGHVADTDVTFVVVPTPSEESGAFSTAFAERAMESVGEELRKKRGYHLVVLTSTVGPGSMDGAIKPALEKASGKKVGPRLGLCYNPEFIALGDVIRGLQQPDFILIGESDPKAGGMLVSIQKAVCTNSPPIERMEFINAELAKISVNSFVTMKMSFANTLAEIAEKLPGGNVDRVTAAIGRDRRVGPAYLKGATGYGGTCLAEGTMVQTAEGLKPVETIAVGELVLSHDGAFHQVTRTFVRDYDGTVISILPEGGIEVTLTPEHPILSGPRVPDDRMRYLDLPQRVSNDGYTRSGHRLRSMTGLQMMPVAWRPAAEVKHGDLLAFPIPHLPRVDVPVLDLRAYHRKLKRSKAPERLLLTRDISRLIGYYLSEGSTWQKEVRFNLHVEETGIMEDLRRIVEGMNYKPRLKRKTAKGVDFVFTSAPFARFLRASFGSQAAVKQLPTSWLGLPNELRIELLKGIMFGDGSTSASMYTLGFTSRQLANQVFSMLLSFGIVASLRRHKRHVGKDGVVHNDSYLVTVRRSSEIQKLGLILPMMPLPAVDSKETKASWIEDGLLYRHVRRVFRSSYRGRVFNLEVEGANSYSTESTALHNCFPRDNVAFAHYASEAGAQALIAQATHKVNLHQPERLLEVLKRKGVKRGTRVGILGLSFKPNTNIVEQSQALMVAGLLAKSGQDVTVYDPAAMDNARAVLGDSVKYSGSAADLVKSSDFIILATPWSEFGSIPPGDFKGKSVFDCWRFFGEKVRKASRYSSIGTP